MSDWLKKTRVNTEMWKSNIVVCDLIGTFCLLCYRSLCILLILKFQIDQSYVELVQYEITVLKWHIIVWILYAFVVGHSMVSTITIRFDNNVIFEKKICIVDVVWLEHFDRYVYISKSWTSLSLWDMFYMCRMCFFTEKYLNLEHFDIILGKLWTTLILIIYCPS